MKAHVLHVLGIVTILGVATPAWAQFDSLATSNASSLDHALPDRPLTLPAWTLESSPRLEYFRLASTRGNSDFTDSFIMLRAGAAFGVTDIVELSVESMLLLDPEVTWSDYFVLRGLLGVLNAARVQIALTGTLPVVVDNDDVLPGFALDVATRVRLVDRLSLFVGHDAFSIRFNQFDPALIDLDINLGIGYALDEHTAVRADTRLASLALAGGDFNSTPPLPMGSCSASASTGSFTHRWTCTQA